MIVVEHVYNQVTIGEYKLHEEHCHHYGVGYDIGHFFGGHHCTKHHCDSNHRLSGHEVDIEQDTKSTILPQDELENIA